MTEADYGILGVVIGAILTGAPGWWSEYNASKKRANYLAIHIVCILDRFIEDCVAVVSDGGQSGQDGHLNIQVAVPKLPKFPEDIDWKSIPPDLMYKILEFPNQILSANNQISGIHEHVAFPPYYEETFEERQFQYATLGLVAFDFASELRSKYGILSVPHDDWNPIEYIKLKKEKIIQYRKDRIEKISVQNMAENNS